MLLVVPALMKSHALQRRALFVHREATEAIASYEKGLSLSSEQPMLWVNLALTYFERRDLGAALRVYSAGLSVLPQHPELEIGICE